MVTIRPCGNPECGVCRLNEPGEPPDCGHEALEWRDVVGAVALVVLFLLYFLVVVQVA